MANEWTLPGIGNDLLTSERFNERRLKTESSLIVNDGSEVSAQNPLPTNGDSVYSKDIWVEESDIGDFSGAITDLFDDLHTPISNTTTDNPKTLVLHFKRTVIANVVGFGCYGGGNFSNIKIELVNSGPVYTTVYDGSSDSAKRTNQTIPLPVTAGFNAIRITFHTSDTICLSNIVLPKTSGVVARLQATKPDNTVTDINATTGGNLKVSFEEYESEVFEADPLPVRLIDPRTGRMFEIDTLTFGIVTIDTVHHELHEGNHYHYCNYQLGNAVGATIEFVLTVPSGAIYPHFLFEVYSSQGATIDVYIGTTGVTGGTSITPRNNNTVSINTSGISIVKDPSSITSDGLFVSGYLAGAGRNAGFNKRDNEFILSDNRSYLVRITSLANGNDISWCCEWYEHDE